LGRLPPLLVLGQLLFGKNQVGHSVTHGNKQAGYPEICLDNIATLLLPDFLLLALGYNLRKVLAESPSGGLAPPLASSLMPNVRERFRKVSVQSFSLRPCAAIMCVFVCALLLQDLLQSCSRGGGRRVEDMCYERRRAEACVDESAHHALANAGGREIV